MKYLFSCFVFVFPLCSHALDDNSSNREIQSTPLLQDYRSIHNSINVSFDSLPETTIDGLTHVNAVLQDHWLKLNDDERKDIAILVSKGEFCVPYSWLLKYFYKPVTFVTHITYHASLLGNIVVLPFSSIFGNDSNTNVGKATSILSIVALLSDNINDFFSKKIESTERMNLILHAMHKKSINEIDL
jgi:hypothetical protein